MTATTPEAAQTSLDRFCATTGDARPRRDADGTPTTVGALGDAEPLRALPAAAYPATVQVTRVVAANATVAFRGNRYSTPPGLAGVDVVVRHRLGAATVDIVAASGAILVTHRLAPAGAGGLVRTPEHHTALQAAVLAAFTTAPPCDRKGNHPPGAAARVEAQRLAGASGDDADVTVDLAVYERVTRGVS